MSPSYVTFDNTGLLRLLGLGALPAAALAQAEQTDADTLRRRAARVLSSVPAGWGSTVGA
jgi:hypothetical protein